MDTQRDFSNTAKYNDSNDINSVCIYL